MSIWGLNIPAGYSSGGYSGGFRDEYFSPILAAYQHAAQQTRAASPTFR